MSVYVLCIFIISPSSDWLVGFLDVLGGAYAACALFNIGLFMVGKLGKVTGSLLLVATLLIAAKTFVLHVYLIMAKYIIILYV